MTPPFLRSSRPRSKPAGRSERPVRLAQLQRWASLGSRATGGRLEETRGAERSEHHSALEARGDRRYLGAPEAGIRGSWRLAIPRPLAMVEAGDSTPRPVSCETS